MSVWAIRNTFTYIKPLYNGIRGFQSAFDIPINSEPEIRNSEIISSLYKERGAEPLRYKSKVKG